MTKTHDVTVWWEDHSEIPGDNLSAADSPGPLIVRTSGAFLKEDRKVLILAKDFLVENDVRGVFTILKKCIVRRRDIIEKTAATTT